MINNKDGTYRLIYLTTLSGNYLIDTRLNGLVPPSLLAQPTSVHVYDILWRLPRRHLPRCRKLSFLLVPCMPTTGGNIFPASCLDIKRVGGTAFPLTVRGAASVVGRVLAAGKWLGSIAVGRGGILL